VVRASATIDLTAPDQSAGDLATVTNFQNVDASGLTATQLIYVVGTSGTNIITGGAGADIIDGGGGADVINAGAGNDTVTFHGTESSVDGGAGSDILVLTSGSTVTAVNFAVVAGTDQTAGDSVSVTNFENLDGSALTTALTVTGSSGVNTITTGSGNDTVDGGGGADVISTGAGDDTVSYRGTELSIDAGAGINTLILQTATDINLGRVDETVGDAVTVQNFQNIDASALGASNDLTFDASQQTQGDLAILAGQGFNTYEMGANFHAQDSLTGESGGFNELKLDGDTTVVMTAQTLVHFNEISVAGNHAYNITANDAAAVANLPFTIDSSTLTSGGSLTYDGSAETDGQLEFVCGGGQYNLTGSHDSDEFDLSDSVSAAAVATITGGPGGDTILAGGTDTFVYNSASDSTSTIHDFLHFIDFSKDHFHLVGTSVGAVNGGVSGQINSGGLFDSNLASVIGSNMGAHDAIVVTANDGTDNGKVFLVVDADGSASYTAGSDYVFEIAFFSGSVTAATFI